MGTQPLQAEIRALKILQVLPSLESGGVEKGTLEISSAIIHAGHQSYVMSAGGRLVSELEQSGTTHIEWNIGKKSLLNLFQVKKIRRWLQREQFDIVHVRSRMPAWVIWLAWNKMDPTTRPRLVSTVHGMHSVSKYSAIVTCGERVIAVSNSIQQYVLTNYPSCSPDKVKLIYRGVDASLFPFGYTPEEIWIDRWREQYPQTSNKLIVTLPGRLTRLKGHLVFLELIEKLRNNGLEVIGLIVGSEDPKRKQYAQEIHQKTEQLGLQNHIIFTGHRSDMREIYANSNLVLSLSNKPESFGRTVLEALSIGTPVIGYNHGGVAEILDALFPDGAIDMNNTQQLFERTRRILNQQHDPIIQNKKFLLSNMKSETLELYAELNSTRNTGTNQS